MSFENKSFPLTVFYLPNPLPDDALALFEGKIAGKLDDVRDELAVGWVSGRHLLELCIDESTAYVGSNLYLNLRLAQRKMPRVLLKAECRMLELQYLQENQTDYVPAKVRREFREDIQSRRLGQIPPSVVGIPMLIDASANMLYLGTASMRNRDHFLSNFYDTVKLELRQQDSAELMFRLFQQDEGDLPPVNFSAENQETGGIPGRDFLTWLWYFSEMRGGKVKMENYGDFELMVDGPLTFATYDEGHGATEIAVKKGNPLCSAEAKAALTVGKKLRKAKIVMVRGEDAWTTMFDADQFNFSSFTPPKGEQIEPLAVLEERLNYLHIFQSAFQEYFRTFVNVLKSPDWEKEQNQIQNWAAERDSL